MWRYRFRPKWHHCLRIPVGTVLLSRFAAALDHRHRLVFARCHAHISAERQKAEDVLCFTPAAAPQSFAKADRESRRVYADQLGGEKMANLVHQHDKAKNEDWCEPTQHENSPVTCARASASAARSSSR